MQMLEILQELPRCDREIGSEQMLLKNITNRLASHKVATNLKFIKKKKKQYLESSIKWSMPACHSKEYTMEKNRLGN